MLQHESRILDKLLPCPVEVRQCGAIKRTVICPPANIHCWHYLQQHQHAHTRSLSAVVAPAVYPKLAHCLMNGLKDEHLCTDRCHCRCGFCPQCFTQDSICCSCVTPVLRYFLQAPKFFAMYPGRRSQFVGDSQEVLRTCHLSRQCCLA